MWWPYLVLLVVLLGLLAFSQRRRRQQVAEEMVRAALIDVGTEVMTTSGLYGTVLGKFDDGTVELSIAPGVTVKWALAALRDADSLPERYRQGRGADEIMDSAETPEAGRPDEQGAG